MFRRLLRRSRRFEGKVKDILVVDDVKMVIYYPVQNLAYVTYLLNGEEVEEQISNVVEVVIKRRGATSIYGLSYLAVPEPHYIHTISKFKNATATIKYIQEDDLEGFEIIIT